jgi:shikimate dehydrogenase
MVRPITKGTVLCMSLAGHPSNVGTRFHNFLYAELDLDFVYKAFTTTDLAAAIAGIRALGIRGCGVSMPYKEASVELVDELDGVGAGRPQLLVNATRSGWRVVPPPTTCRWRRRWWTPRRPSWTWSRCRP